MKWFKHSVDSHDDPDISDAEDLFGDAGYSIFFKILEVYAREFNSIKNDGFLTVSLRFLARKLRKSSGKVQEILNFYQNRGRIKFKIDGLLISIKIPRFLDIADNWTKRPKEEKQQTLCSSSVVATQSYKKKKKKENNTNTASEKQDVEQTNFYITKKKQKLKGKRLETFNMFWDAFDYKFGKAEAADFWIDIPQLTDSLVFKIIEAAKKEAKVRPGIIEKGKTPKMAQGWLSAKRWEDEFLNKPKIEKEYI